jgi:AraC family transcriptional regulator
MLQVYLHRAVYESVAAELCSGNPPRRTITPRFAIHDPMLEQLLLAVATALREPTPPATLYIDTLAQMMAAHLASASTARFDSAAPSKPAPKPAPHLQRLADYIEAHLDEDLSLDRLGAEAVLSPLYLIRAFKAAFGESPHQYVMARRIERAKTLLRATDTPVADIALACGFSSQSHLCNRFQRVVGTTPVAYRRVHSTVRVSMPGKVPTKM